MNKKVRFVDASHSRALFHSLYKAYADELAQYSSRLRKEPVTEKLIDELYFNDPLLNKYFIEADGETIGFIILQYVDVVFGVVKPIWYVVEFYILPEHRRKGYGEATVKSFLEFYKKDFFYYVLKENIPAKRFWGNITKTFHLKEVYRPDVVREDEEELETYAFEVC